MKKGINLDFLTGLIEISVIKKFVILIYQCLVLKCYFEDNES